MLPECLIAFSHQAEVLLLKEILKKRNALQICLFKKFLFHGNGQHIKEQLIGVDAFVSLRIIDGVGRDKNTAAGRNRIGCIRCFNAARSLFQQD